MTVEDLLLVLSGMRGTFDRAKGEADLEEALRLSASDVSTDHSCNMIHEYSINMNIYFSYG